MVVGLAGATRAVYEAFDAWQEEKVRQLLQEAYFENAADEGFAAQIGVRLQDPRVRRLLIESVRTALESVADEVLPAIAALMREYEREGKAPDAFFRGLCRVLQDLSSEELAELRSLVFGATNALAKVPDTAKTEKLQVTLRGAELDVAAHGTVGSVMYESIETLAGGPHANRLVHLLAGHGMGTVLVGDWENPEWRIDRDLLMCVRRILAPS